MTPDGNLSPREQVAVMEVIGADLHNVISGSVSAYQEPTSSILIAWKTTENTQQSHRFAPIQFFAIISAVETERMLAELNAPPSYADADHSTHSICDPTLGCIERNDQ